MSFDLTLATWELQRTGTIRICDEAACEFRDADPEENEEGGHDPYCRRFWAESVPGVPYEVRPTEKCPIFSLPAGEYVFTCEQKGKQQ